MRNANKVGEGEERHIRQIERFPAPRSPPRAPRNARRSSALALLNPLPETCRGSYMTGTAMMSAMLVEVFTWYVVISNQLSDCHFSHAEPG